MRPCPTFWVTFICYFSAYMRGAASYRILYKIVVVIKLDSVYFRYLRIHLSSARGHYLRLKGSRPFEGCVQ